MNDMFSQLFGNGAAATGSPITQRVVAALDRIAEASELSAAIEAMRMFDEQGSDAAADLLKGIIKKLSLRLVKRHE